MSHNEFCDYSTFETVKISSIILSLTLTSLILFNSIRVSVTYAYYELDPVGFIERLCENKDQPELQCNGKCHLKKVAERNTENQQEPAKFTSLKEITLFVVENLNMHFSSLQESEINLSYYQDLYAFKGIYPIDHPPQV